MPATVTELTPGQRDTLRRAFYAAGRILRSSYYGGFTVSQVEKAKLLWQDHDYDIDLAYDSTEIYIDELRQTQFGGQRMLIHWLRVRDILDALPNTFRRCRYQLRHNDRAVMRELGYEI
ncbi:MAG: hypothetical protein ACYS30_22635 [Planctomycetota bacterium]|jgi:hypothetical protein